MNLNEKQILKFLSLFIIIPALWIVQGNAQTSANFNLYDLKSFTDSSGSVHLYFRVHRKNAANNNRRSNIYHYNVDEQILRPFLEENYPIPGDAGLAHRVLDFQFFDNDPDKFIYIGSTGPEGILYINRMGDITFEYSFRKRGLNTPALFTTGSDTSTVYAQLINQWVKSEDGGKSWPAADDILNNELSDNEAIDFFPFSVSPYDKQIMFGEPREGLAFSRTTNEGRTVESFENGILPLRSRIFYDCDGNHIYAIAQIHDSDSCNPHNRCFALFSNHKKGESGYWVREQIFDNNRRAATHPKKSGVIYVWNADSLYVSTNYGTSFSPLYYYGREEISEVAAEGSSVFFLTKSTLYQIKGGSVVPLITIADF